MAHHIYGFINKRKRLDAADAKITQPEGRYDRTMLFNKGDRRGVLAVWEHRMEWTLYADSQFCLHVDWNDPDSACLNDLPSTCSLLEVMTRLNDYGFLLYDQIIHQ